MYSGERAWVGLGSNMGDAPANITRGMNALAASGKMSLLRKSSYYHTKPWGGVAQDDYINAVAEFETDLGPRALLELLLGVENQLGRRRDGVRWGPRVIDLDLLLYGERIVFRQGLTIPHPRMHRRWFVLAPLVELEPGLRIPARGTAASCLARLEKSDTNERGYKLES